MLPAGRRVLNHAVSFSTVRTPGIVLLLTLVACLATPGCRALFRYPAEARLPLPAEDLLHHGMNPFLLTNHLSDRVVVEIDWVEGGRPHSSAVEGLRQTLREHCAEGKQIEVVLDDEIPLAKWRKATTWQAQEDLLGSFVDHDGPDPETEELIYVAYLPGEIGIVGLMLELGYEQAGAVRIVPSLLIYYEKIRQVASLWITPRKIERATLVHEIGHVLGLVSLTAHMARGNPRHCTEPQCVMTHQRTRSQLYNAPSAFFTGRTPTRYCKRCRADLEAVKRLWAVEARDADTVRWLRDRKRVWKLAHQAHWYADRGRWREAETALGEALELVEGDEVCYRPEFDELRKIERFEPLLDRCGAPRT